VKVLVVGLYPPQGGADANHTMATVRELATGGDEVEVFSTVGSAAQHRGPIAGISGAFDVWRRARSFDAVVVQVTGHSPLRAPGRRRARLTRLVDCLAWGAALRMMKRSRLVVPNLAVVPGSIGGRSGRFLWGGAGRVVVSSEHSRQRLADAGCSPDRIEVVAPPPVARDRPETGWDHAVDQKTAEEMIVQRAAEDRRAAARARRED
jgi:hypothetical protein